MQSSLARAVSTCIPTYLSLVQLISEEKERFRGLIREGVSKSCSMSIVQSTSEIQANSIMDLLTFNLSCTNL